MRLDRSYLHAITSKCEQLREIKGVVDDAQLLVFTHGGSRP